MWTIIVIDMKMLNLCTVVATFFVVLWVAEYRSICVCVASWERDEAEVGRAGGVGTEHCRDLQFTSAGSRSQDQETKEGELHRCALCIELLSKIIIIVIIMTMTCLWPPVHLMNVDWAPGGCQPSDKANWLGLRVSRKLALTIYIHRRHCHYYSACKLLLILLFHGGCKDEST